MKHSVTCPSKFIFDFYNSELGETPKVIFQKKKTLQKPIKQGSKKNLIKLFALESSG